MAWLLIVLTKGIALIEKDVEAAWRDHHSLCMGLYSLRVVLQNLVCDFADPPCEELLPRATTALEKSEIYVLLHDRHEAEVLRPPSISCAHSFNVMM